MVIVIIAFAGRSVLGTQREQVPLLHGGSEGPGRIARPPLRRASLLRLPDQGPLLGGPGEPQLIGQLQRPGGWAPHGRLRLQHHLRDPAQWIQDPLQHLQRRQLHLQRPLLRQPGLRPVPVLLPPGVLREVLPIRAGLQSGQRDQRLQERGPLQVIIRDPSKRFQMMNVLIESYWTGGSVVRCTCPPNYNGSLCEYRRPFIPARGDAALSSFLHYASSS